MSNSALGSEQPHAAPQLEEKWLESCSAEKELVAVADSQMM